MMSTHSGNAATSDNLLEPPDQGSPGNVRRLGMTRSRARKDFKDNENPEEKARRHKELELKPLYKELLYTIMHKLGKPESATVFTDDELRKFIREAFSMTESEHSTLMEKVQHTEPPVYCLMATVKEAKGILGKDITGFSDPYCLLTIMEDEKEKRTRRSRAKPRKAIVKDVVSDDKIFPTEIKKQTLNPIWNQTFVIEFEDCMGASFHLEMWDKDEEVSLTQKLEEFNFHNIKRMIKDAKKEKGADDFLGNVVLKLQDLHCKEDKWYDLEPKTETYPDRGKCHLNLKFIHKERDTTLSAGRSAYVNYCGILQQFVQAYISTQQGSVPWKGELCAEAQVLLELYATQNDLSPFLQDLAKWVAYSKLYQTLEVCSSVLFQQITSIEYHWHQQVLPSPQKKELGDSLHDFLHYGLHLVSKYRDVFPQSATLKLQTLLRILMQICKTQAFQKLNPAQFDLQNEVTDAVQEGTQEWFTIKKGLHQPMTKDLLDTVRALIKLTEEVQLDIKHSKDVWNKIFSSTVQMDMFTIVYQKLESLLAAEVRDTLSLLEGQLDQDLANSLSPLYQLLRAIHKDKAYLQKRDKLMELTNFHEGFREALPYWLNKVFSTTKDLVEKAVLLDQLQPLQSNVKHSSSAVDLVDCIQPICKLWELLSWPDPEEAFMLMVKITEDVCKIMATYCQILKERVRTLSKDSDHSSAINMVSGGIDGDLPVCSASKHLCVVVNDLEYLRSVAGRLDTKLNWAGLQARTHTVIAENQFHNTLPSQLEQLQSILGREIHSALDTLGKQLNTDIETHIRSMGTRHRLPSKSREDAVDPLMKYLEKELQYMHENLVQENFSSLLTPLWMNSVKIIHQMMAQYPHQEGLMVFSQRMQYTLQCLEDCFHAGGEGVPLEALHTEDYKRLKAQLTQNCLSCQQLIERYLDQKVWEQKVYSGEKYGAVTVITSYRRSDQRLRVEVLNAANLLPMDSNGFSDPFVQLCLEPRHVFFEVEPRRTQIKTCDLNPLFEEAFEFMVSLEQCRALGACLVVTVLDHDTLSSDDFEGEAFLALKAVPGVGGGGGDEADGHTSQPDAIPAQIRLPLMHPKPNDDSLKLLESRKGDKEGQAFVKKRRWREKQSMEGVEL